MKIRRLKIKNIIIFSVFFIVLILLLCCFIFFKKTNIDIKNELVSNLYSYVGSNDLSFCRGLIHYDSKKVDYDSISIENKICNSYLHMDNSDITLLIIDKRKKNNTCSINKNIDFYTENDEKVCNVKKIDIEIIIQIYENIYGNKLTEYPEFYIDDMNICKYSEGYYYCGRATEYNITIGKIPETYRNIKRVLKYGNKLIIYDRFIKIYNNKCFNNYVDNLENVNCSNSLAESIDYKFLKKYGSIYKHIFQLNNDKYYWISSEPLS